LDLVLLYGLPASGKLMVPRELSRLTGYRVLHNHLTIDSVKAVFDFDTGPFWRLVHEFRFRLIEEAAREDVSLILTNVPTSAARIEGIFSIVRQQGGRPLAVRLDCPRAMLDQRVAAEDRRALGKLATVEDLDTFLARYEMLQELPGVESLVLDTSRLAPREAAATIVAHYGLTIL
jgi:predicted kinase